MLQEIAEELDRARAKYPGKHPTLEHAAYVLQREYKELERELDKNHFKVNNQRVKAEAIQVAAMCCRLVEDCLDE